MLKYILISIIIYLFIGLFLFFLQRKLVFNKSGKPQNPEYYGLYNISEELIEVDDSIKLLSWLSKPKVNYPIIIYFHGNSFDIGERSYRIKNYINNGFGVLLPAYRGYSGNKGNPTEKNLYKDSQKVINWIMKKLNINESNIILYGESLGTGVVVELSQNKNYKAVILEAPFTSLIDIAKRMYPIYPVKYLVLDKFDNVAKINNIISPILFIHGKKDEVIPFEMGRKLYNAKKNFKENLFIDEAMHNNLYDYGIANKVIEFINKH